MASDAAAVAVAVGKKAKEARGILGVVQRRENEIHHLVSAIQVMAFNISYPVHFDENFDWGNEEEVSEAARACSEALASIAQLARLAKEQYSTKSGEVQSILFSLLTPEQQAEELGE